MTAGTEEHRAVPGSPRRRQVLDALVASPEPLDAATVAELLGLHVTTARFHLDRLTTAGLANRRSGSEGRRGRPRLLYTPAGTARSEAAQEQLIRVLAGALDRKDDAAADGLRAGRAWAEGYGAPDPDDVVPHLVEVLDRLGFAPEPDEGATAIQLRGCPFRDVARAHPDVVCSAHRGLIDGLLDGTRSQASLLPFVEPQLCTVTLTTASA